MGIFPYREGPGKMIGPNRTTTGPAPAIYLDANPLADRHLTGIGRYTARIALALASYAPVRFFSNGTYLILPEDLDWSQDQDLGAWGRRVWKSRRRPFQKPPEDSVGIFGCLRPIEKLFPFEISILHDFTPLVVPQTHAEKTRGMFQGFFAKSLLSSDRALAVSHSTKADAAWLTGFDQDKIVVAHSGPTLCAARHGHTRTVTRRPTVGLVVSTLEPRKNAFFLLDWFHDTKALPDGSELWWVGPTGWLTSRRQLKKYRQASGNRRVQLLGVVSDERLCQLYQEAGWSIYPSLYEGFGFPVLDALRHGTPVLASAHSALREFECPGVFLFDPCDSDSVDLAWQKFQEAGSIVIPRQAIDDYYNWDRVARTLLEMMPGHLKTKVQNLESAA
ncbi:glycosyltransferase family 1 protein [soil metagenome]